KAIGHEIVSMETMREADPDRSGETPYPPVGDRQVTTAMGKYFPFCAARCSVRLVIFPSA
ncbi:MAG TPA: hypothetical protein VN901_15285, partial [Candidatus Acidoferrales bacterium]|nr:hypothetical protein [Candidatus Acidoferrales bacterium]